jgi:hypothetical protein
MKSGALSIAAIAFLGLGLLIIVALMLTAPVHASQVSDSTKARVDVRQTLSHGVQTVPVDVAAPRSTSR